MPMDSQTRVCVYPAVAVLFDYPQASFLSDFEAAIEIIVAKVPDARATLEPFFTFAESSDRHAMEEIHTRTFDIMARCDPYVSSQVFGQESYKRGQLMVGLVEAYTAAGLTWLPELPDHIAIILKNMACFSDTEWRDMVEHCLYEALLKMRAMLKGSTNPYAFLFDALIQVVKGEFPQVAERQATDFSLDVLDDQAAEEASRV